MPTQNRNGSHAAVIQCPNCGEDYSVTYKRCPFCDEKTIAPRAARSTRDDEDDYAAPRRRRGDEDDYDTPEQRNDFSVRRAEAPRESRRDE